MFQYLGSRGAQRASSGVLTPPGSFNTWAREEPNSGGNRIAADEVVSILGLARSPTCGQPCRPPCRFRFNTWAREEPNGHVKVKECVLCSGFNTWAREEPNREIWSIANGSAVSILGLARSPTYCPGFRPSNKNGFNTWAREEPNGKKK